MSNELLSINDLIEYLQTNVNEGYRNSPFTFDGINFVSKIELSHDRRPAPIYTLGNESILTSFKKNIIIHLSTIEVIRN